MKGKFPAALLMTGLLVASFWTIASRVGATDIDQMIASAKTAADHQAIANYFEQQAAYAQEEVALHQKMKQAYAALLTLQGPFSAGFGLKEEAHCQVLQYSYENIAAEDEALAKMHREIAAKLGGSH
jgi:hypothetical protein